MRETPKKPNQEPRIKILYGGSSCPPSAVLVYEHDFIELVSKEVYFCKKCGLTIKYEKENK